MEKDQRAVDSQSIGIEIGGTKTQVGIGSASAGLLPPGVIRRPVVREQGAIGILHNVVSMVDESLSTSHRMLADINQIGIAFGGIVDSARGVTMKSYQIDGWTDFPLKEWAERQWDRPVFVENDASTAGLAESLLGNGRGCSRVFYITVGSGVGGGWILNGKVDNGQGLGAAEIGHMCVDPFGGVACTCGSRGCLEVFASATAIVRMTREASPRYPDSVLQGTEDLTAKTIFEAGQQGDELALEIFRRMGVYLGIGLANLINILNPEMIVIGGGVVNGWDLFEKHMHQQVEERAFPLLAARVKIERAKCGDDAGLLGAARLAFKG